MRRAKKRECAPSDALRGGRRPVGAPKPPQRAIAPNPREIGPVAETTGDGETLATQKALAVALGWPGSTLRTRMQDPAWPVPRKPPWPVWIVSTVSAWADARFAADPEPDPMLVASGESSPMLERWRAARAQLAELELKTREGQLVRIDTVDGTLKRMCEAIRRAGDVLQRQFGPEPYRVLDDALDELEREIETWTEAKTLYED